MSPISKPQNEISIAPLNPMVFHSRFQHITENIFQKMDIKCLRNCREVSNKWQNSIDDPNILWKKVVDKLGCNVAFQFACLKGAGATSPCPKCSNVVNKSHTLTGKSLNNCLVHCVKLLLPFL